MSNARYTPTENGYMISGSSEIFNRTLYGSHTNDDKDERFFTFAGDAPQFMGAVTDWKKDPASRYAKCGTLISGLALTPGQRVGFFYSDDIDISSRWFHNSEDVRFEFQNGYALYDLTQMSPWFPDVRVHIETYPLLPEDGFLVRYVISTDQRVIFTAGFGGLTDCIARFEYKDEPKRNFSAADCVGNTVQLGRNRATVTHPDGCRMHIGSSFATTVTCGSAEALASPYPTTFLGEAPKNADDTVVKLSAVIEPGQTLDGYLVVLHNADDAALDRWLTHADPIRALKRQIAEKHACIHLQTPDHPLDLTVAPTVIALDASYHKNSFHHGAFGYHAPFLGWRNWYAPTVLGWNERVETTMAAHLGQMVTEADGEERVWFDGGGAREGDGPSPYHDIKNSTGHLPFLLGETMPYYNMQECALDMMLHHIEWTGNLQLANTYFDKFCRMLDWEERLFDPDGDGLYQNFLNTWISDGHHYNGAGCAQASAYNYRANKVMATLAKKLGRPAEVFERRAAKIKAAVKERLWLPARGVLAESADTVGNCLVHPSPELSTIYLAIDCDIVDPLQAYTMLKYTEHHIPSIETPERHGRLSYCSDWLPKKYSTFGIFPAENAYLALAYYKLGLKNEANALLSGIADCYFTGRNPGMAAHVQSARGTADLADLDFTDVSSMYLRAMVEGLFGIGINALEEGVTIAPHFPDDWDYATLSLSDITLQYTRRGREEIVSVRCDRIGKKRICLPMRSTRVEVALLDGAPVPYTITPAVGGCVVTVETEACGQFCLRLTHGDAPLPHLTLTESVVAGGELAVTVHDGSLVSVTDTGEMLKNLQTVGGSIYASVGTAAGERTLFVRVRQDEFDAYLPADYTVLSKVVETPPLQGGTYQPLDIAAAFNCSLTEIHNRDFMSPRPEGYSIGVFPNGRYAWEWNHRGHNQLYVDDSALRHSGGVIHTASGIPFATPSEGENVACVSMWDNFPTALRFPLSGSASELALLFVSTTNSMQTGVENARITVHYTDGTAETSSLVYPKNIDDWLVPALQAENENYYFSDYNHATVQRIRLDAAKTLSDVTVEAVANEVILATLAITLRT